MAKRFGGRHSPPRPDGQGGGMSHPEKRKRLANPVPALARANLLLVAPLPLLITAFDGDSFNMILNMIAFAALVFGAGLLRDGLKAEAAYNAREIARRPAFPRKFFAAEFTGIGIALATFVPDGGLVPPVIYGLVATTLQLIAFGVDPMRDKGVETAPGKIDKIVTERVTKVVDAGEDYLKSMADVIATLGDRRLDERVDEFQATARDMFRAVERDPRDLPVARKYMGVYLMGARDATRKFAEVYAIERSPRDRADYIALLDDMQAQFEARNDMLLADNRTDMEIEIEVLRERLQREGVRPKTAEES
jgi:hypothetical protein